jgi:hypothetical protein
MPCQPAGTFPESGAYKPLARTFPELKAIEPAGTFLKERQEKRLEQD